MDVKITKEEFDRISREAASVKPLELFEQGIRSPMTLGTYRRFLRLTLCDIMEELLEGSFEERVEQLVRRIRENPEWGVDLMLSLSRALRARCLLPHDDPNYFNPESFGNYFKPLKKLLDMNDVMIPWKRVYATYPEADNVQESRGWTRSEIQKILRFTRGPTDRAIVLVAASSGMRAGGFESLRWSDLRPIYVGEGGRLTFDSSEDAGGSQRPSASQPSPVCAMIIVYARTSASYPAFITPEAYAALTNYCSAWTSDVGRPPKPEEPMFKKAGCLPRKSTTSLLKRRVERVIQAAGLRAPERKSQRRFDVPMMNGFRRFWNKACKESVSNESPLSTLIKKEYMMGHVGLVSLDRNYFKTHVLELAEEYLLSVPALTIDDAERLRLANSKQATKIRQLENEKTAEMADLRRTVEELTRRIAAR